MYYLYSVNVLTVSVSSLEHVWGYWLCHWVCLGLGSVGCPIFWGWWSIHHLVILLLSIAILFMLKLRMVPYNKNLGSYFILSKHLHVNLINSSKTYLPLSSIFGSLLSTVYFQSCSDSIDSISYLHCESAR